MSTGFDLIVFDWDGTLMDSAPRIADSLRSAAHDLGLEEHHEQGYRDVIGLGLREAVEALYPALDDDGIERFTDRYRHYFLHACPTPAALFDGARPLLERLASQPLALAVATGKSRKGLERALDETACRGYFHSTRTADETRSKPDPAMLLQIIEETGVAADRTLMVGDTEYDLEMARRAGVAALAVGYGAHPRERLRACRPLALVDSVAELSRWLEETIRFD